MLKICGTDNYGVGLLRPELIGVSGGSEVSSGLLLVPGLSFVSATIPNVADGKEFEVHLFGIFEE
ncbi:hypothetical protein SDC9_141459 [bioreactor metagenome]|uniref:Uncharacterized protein n=1 Tax=bioreactor metagenome TaxID=1076179 RepID=A0A645E0D5_9ZZZZ